MEKKLLLVSISVLACAVFAQVAGIYDILSDDQKIGECAFELKKHPVGYFLSFNITMSIGGTKTTCTGETYFDEGLHPTSYIANIVSPGVRQTISAKFGEGKITISGGSGVQQMENEIDFPSTGYIVDQNNFAHWYVLGTVINPMVGSFGYDIVIPQLMVAQRLTMRNVGEKTIEGKNMTNFEGTLGSTEVYLSISSNKELLSINFPTQHISAKLVQLRDLAIESSASPKAAHLITPENLSDKEFMSQFLKAKRFEGTIQLNPNSRLDRIYLNRKAQTFVGTINNDNISGEVVVSTFSHRVTLSDEWPIVDTAAFQNVQPEYISPAPGVYSDDAGIMAVAKNTVSPAKTVWEAARAINLWVYRNIQYALLRYQSKDALVKGVGDSHTKACLCVAMLRSVGIPSRVVRGLFIADVPLDHSWVEVFLGPNIGWAPMDPTTGEADEISARHISLWLGEEEPPTYAEKIAVEVKKIK